MIDKIRIQNFKCLRDVTVELGPLTVLVGSNDSGKTSLFEAIRLPGTPKTHEEGKSLVWNRDQAQSICINLHGNANGRFEYYVEYSSGPPPSPEYLFHNGEMVYRVAIPDESNDPKAIPQHFFSRQFSSAIWAALREGLATSRAFPGLYDVAQLFSSIKQYRFDPQVMRSPSEFKQFQSLDPDGKNLASILHGMLIGPNRIAMDRFIHDLHSEIPTLTGVLVRQKPDQPYFYQIEYTLNGDSGGLKSIPSSQASDGAVLLTGFLALVYGEGSEILLIEEPENGLHPNRLKNVVDLLRKLTTGEIGGCPRQVVLTTHSPILLNYVQPEEVRIFRRNAVTGTQVTRMDAIPNMDRLRQDFTAGELWSILGEDQLVEGVAP